MQATATIERTETVAVDTTRVPFGIVTAEEKAEKLILRWYQLKELHPRNEWDTFAIATQALIHIENHGVVSFIESTPPALPEPAELTKTIWTTLQKIARRAMRLTNTPWTGGAYYFARRCGCPSTNPAECSTPDCTCTCSQCD